MLRGWGWIKLTLWFCTPVFYVPDRARKQNCAPTKSARRSKFGEACVKENINNHIQCEFSFTIWLMFVNNGRSARWPYSIRWTILFRNSGAFHCCRVVDITESLCSMWLSILVKTIHMLFKKERWRIGRDFCLDKVSKNFEYTISFVRAILLDCLSEFRSGFKLRPSQCWTFYAIVNEYSKELCASNKFGIFPQLSQYYPSTFLLFSVEFCNKVCANRFWVAIFSLCGNARLQSSVWVYVCRLLQIRRIQYPFNLTKNK